MYLRQIRTSTATSTVGAMVDSPAAETDSVSYLLLWEQYSFIVMIAGVVLVVVLQGVDGMRKVKKRPKRAPHKNG
jgi:hypothetical protein